MRRVALFSLAIAIVTLATTATTGAQAAKPDPSMTTIVGCLVQENPTGAANANDYFVRTPTVALPVGATVAVGKPGTASTSTSSGTPAKDSFYRITGMDSARLRPHVGHRVEIQGHLSSKAPDASAAGVNTTKTTVDKDGKATVTVEKRVDIVGDIHTMNLKMVSADCK
jgi:hypothetical protein